MRDEDKKPGEHSVSPCPEDTFGIVREELRHWPYTIHQIHDTLDLSLIEGRAKQILFQALNTQNITAFLGSGVSAAYGRMGWYAWQNAQLNTTETLAKTLIELINVSMERSLHVTSILQQQEHALTVKERSNVRAATRWLSHRLLKAQFVKEEIEKLKSSFDLAQNSNDDLPIKFEIAQKLHDLILLNRELYLSADLKPGSENYQSEFDLTNVWGIRPDISAGAPIKSLNCVRELLPTIEDIKQDENKDEPGYVQKKHETLRAMMECMLNYCEIAERPEGRMSFETLAKVLLVDECAHAEQLLLSGLEGANLAGRKITFPKKRLIELREELNVLSEDNCKRDISGIRQDPDRFKVLQYFRIDQLLHAIKSRKTYATSDDEATTRWEPLLSSLEERFKKYLNRTGNERVFLTPTSRFLVQTFLRFSPNPILALELLSNNSPLSGSDYSSRRSVIANRLDPLDRTIRQLNIHRYLTTNYDFEIERYYQDLGYRKSELSDFNSLEAETHIAKTQYDRRDYRVDGLGSILWDTTFDPKRSSDLVTFATGHDGADAAVFHLHGRATKSDPLIITERNYMHMYVNTGDDREMIDEGITMAFSATPILFIGLGMEEADVLRPLRQFISDNDSSRGYTAMVLLPADTSIEKRSKFASSLYLRYGTHTIFYGSGEIELECDGVKPERVAIDWLYRITEFIKELIEITAAEKEKFENIDFVSGDTIEKIKNKYEKSSVEELLKRLSNKVGEMKEDLRQPHIEPTDDALPFLFGMCSLTDLINKFEEGKQEFPVLKAPFFTSQRPGELSEARAHRMVLDPVSVDGSESLSFYLELLSHVVKLSVSGPSDSMHVTMYLRELAAQQSILEGLRGGLLTASLCTSLTAIEKEWRVWWKHWQQRPPHRKPSIESLRDDLTVSRSNPLPGRYVRYRIINSISDMTNAENIECEKIHENAFVDIDNITKTNIRSFDTFIEAVAQQVATIQALKQQETVSKTDGENGLNKGRRFYTVAASTGLGKGTFFSIFTTRLGFTSYLQAAHPNWDVNSKGLDRTVIMGGLFLNFSYATEIASTFDMSLNVIKERLCWLYGVESVINELSGLVSSGYLSNIIDLSKLADCPAIPLLKRDKLVLIGLLKKPEMWSSTIPEFLVYDRRCYSAQLYVRYDTCSLIEKHLKKDNMKILLNAIEVRANLAMEGLHKEFLGVGRSEFLRIVSIKYGELCKQVRENYLLHCKELCEINRFKKIKNINPRFVICLNSCELFFDSDRKAKNMEIADFLRFLSSPEMSKIPFDLVTIGSENRLGAPWTGNWEARSQKVQNNKFSDPEVAHKDNKNVLINNIIFRPHCDIKSRHGIVKRAKYSSIYFDDLEKYLDTVQNTKINADPKLVNTDFVNNVYYSRMLDPVRLLVDNFLPLATLLYLVNTDSSEKSKDKLDFQFHTLYRSCQKQQVDIWSTDPIELIEDNTKSIKDSFLQNIFSVAFKIDNDLRSEIEQRCTANNLSQQDNLRNYLADINSTGGAIKNDEWRVIRESLSANRFCLTMLLAAAQEIALSEDTWLVGVQRAIAFIWNTVNSVKNVSNSITEETVLQSVLDVYRRYHKIGDPDYDIELHHHLLRNIAVINSPISSNVIVRLPSIREYLNSTVGIDKLGLGRRRMIVKALSVLGDRGLVFRLAPHTNLIELAEKRDELKESGDNRFTNYTAANKEWGERWDYRYALHRLVQQYSITKLGSTAFEPVRINTFTPSLYASMPSGIPRLSHEAYRYLRALMVGLSQYPDIPHKNRHDPVWLYAAQDRPTNVQSLRAAMTLVRSTFSIAVVSRFEEYKSIPGEREQRTRGYFETYKVRLRWIIRKAWELHVPEFDESGKLIDIGTGTNPSHDEFKRINALYRDEIVWLYNEVGLICLVQGNLRDAVAHLRQAIALNEGVEGIGGGRQHSLISFNLAIAQMERGRLSKAIARLEDLCVRERKINSRIYYLARGYLGLLMHLGCKRKESKKLLKEAANYFEGTGENRATAIFRNHLARLIVDRKPKKALRELKSAREHAEAGGHEDIRHHILISSVRVSQLALPNPHKRLERDRLIVQEVEEYARVLGIPSLMCDALHTKALMLLENGDSTSSGRVLIRAMAIARRNDMQLRLSSTMTAYARILLHRGNVASSRRLLISSLEIAKKYEYALQIDRTQRILEDEDFTLGRLA